MLYVALALFAARGSRWAYGAFVGMALMYFPQKGGFTFKSPGCSWALGGDLIVTSTSNYSHIGLAALFCAITYVHFARNRLRGSSPLYVAVVVTLVISVLVEIAQGASDTGNCEVRDLIPNSIGILVTLAAIGLWTQARRAWAPSRN